MEGQFERGVCLSWKPCSRPLCPESTSSSKLQKGRNEGLECPFGLSEMKGRNSKMLGCGKLNLDADSTHIIERDQNPILNILYLLGATIWMNTDNNWPSNVHDGHAALCECTPLQKPCMEWHTTYGTQQHSIRKPGNRNGTILLTMGVAPTDDWLPVWLWATLLSYYLVNVHLNSSIDFRICFRSTIQSRSNGCQWGWGPEWQKLLLVRTSHLAHYMPSLAEWPAVFEMLIVSNCCLSGTAVKSTILFFPPWVNILVLKWILDIATYQDLSLRELFASLAQR